MLISADNFHKNLSFFSYQQYLREICRPLFHNSVIRYFDFERYYYTGKHFILSNYCPEKYELFYNYYYNQHNYPSLKDFTNNKQRYLLLSNTVELPTHLAVPKFENNVHMASEYHLSHRFNICEHNVKEKCYELFTFGIELKSSQAIEQVLTNMDLLEKFLMYFKMKVKPLIKLLTKKCIYLPKFLEEKVISTPDTAYFNRKNVDEYLENFFEKNLIETRQDDKVIFQRKKFLFSDDGKIVRLTAREAECLDHLSRGFSFKEIARCLNISPRTVETHLDHIKTKANYRSVVQLISNLRVMDLSL